MNRKKYSYNGPVMIFGKFVGNWKGSTMAESEAKAKNNLAYQYKTGHNLISSAKVTLPGKVEVAI